MRARFGLGGMDGGGIEAWEGTRDVGDGDGECNIICSFFTLLAHHHYQQPPHVGRCRWTKGHGYSETQFGGLSPTRTRTLLDVCNVHLA
jgi:hypothetical protein